jgi:mono/diheme cytochrome c family protein
MRTSRITIFIAMAILTGFVSLAFGQEEPAKAKAPDLAVGESVYKSKCAFCHGDAGDGQGPSGKFLKPSPGNFTDSEWIHGGEIADIVNTIKKGVSGTAMVGFEKTLTEEEIQSVAAYVKQFSAGKGAATEGAAPSEAEEEKEESHEGHEQQEQQ